MEPRKYNVPNVSELCYGNQSRKHCEHWEEDGHCCTCNKWAPEMCQNGCGQSQEDHNNDACTTVSQDGHTPVFDLIAHIANQREFSIKTFGPIGQGQKPEGVIQHIEKECGELRVDPSNLSEWIDIVILGFDGAIKSGCSPQEIAEMLFAKQIKNERRNWPDWRKMNPTEAIEHVRTPEEEEQKQLELALKK